MDLEVEGKAVKNLLCSHQDESWNVAGTVKSNKSDRKARDQRWVNV